MCLIILAPCYSKDRLRAQPVQRIACLLFWFSLKRKQKQRLYGLGNVESRTC